MGAVGLIVQTFIGLSFFISSIWEKEPRASVYALLQFLAMTGALVVFLYLAWIDFFGTGMGLAILVAGYVCAALAAFFLLARFGANPEALKGAKGLIVGKIRRHDERDIVFARNRALRPGSEQYKAYYREHPEKEAFDAQRRARGGPIGNPGIIDRPHSDANVAMTLASLNMPHYL